MALRALRASGTIPAQNFGLEEALLEAFDGPEVLLLYVNEPCLVAGRSQNPWAEFSPDSELPRFRRISGGGAVYQDLGNLNWALLLSRELHEPEAELEALARALGGLGLDLLPGPRGGLFGSPGSPIAGRKVGGSARRFSPRAVLHHGTLLVSADLGRLAASLGGLRLLEDRSVPSVPSPVANLDEARPGLGVDEVAAALARGLGAGEAGVAEEAVDPALAARSAARLSSWDWIYGLTPPFALELPEGGLLRVGGGRILEAPRGAPPRGARFDYHAAARPAPRASCTT